jgi:inorganic pyrophosphatase
VYRGCISLDALPEHYCAEIDYFFRSYLDLKDPGIVTDWGDAETARRVIEEGHERYRRSSRRSE